MCCMYVSFGFEARAPALQAGRTYILRKNCKCERVEGGFNVVFVCVQTPFRVYPANVPFHPYIPPGTGQHGRREKLEASRRLLSHLSRRPFPPVVG
eukprot:scaffold1019_cov97-Skeletonema_marinoi.AAC.12